MVAVPSDMTRRTFFVNVSAAVGLKIAPSLAAPSLSIAPQPYFANVKRAIDALATLGAPIGAADAARIAALTQSGCAISVDAAEQIVDRYTLARLAIDADGTGHVSVGGAERSLVEQGWRMFLVRVANSNSWIGDINFASTSQGPGSMMSYTTAPRSHIGDALSKGPRIEKMWLLSQLYEAKPVMVKVLARQTVANVVSLSGIPVEYHIIQIFSRESGRRSDKFVLSALPKSGGYRPDGGHHDFDFNCFPSRTVALSMRDADGRGCVASLVIKDKLDHVYPPQAMRVAPDLYFQPQIYRGDGETILLPAGNTRWKADAGRNIWLARKR
jgi:hypothetical protein